MSDLFAQIAKLRGEYPHSYIRSPASRKTNFSMGSINEYKTQDKDISSSNAQPYPASSYRGSSRGGRGGRGRGWSRGRGGHAPIRNKTLIVNNNADPNGEFVSVKSATGLRLVNKQVYAQELEKKTTSYEEVRLALVKKRAEIRRHKAEVRISKLKVRLDYCDLCIIDGHTYAVSRYGAKLALLDPVVDELPPQVQWNGWNYKRDKAGNLKLQGQKVFLKEQCRFFQKTGECSRGTKCKYTHNSEKIALCPWVIKGTCNGISEDGTKCHLSHTPSEFNVTLCHFYLRGSCRNPECPFLHTHPDLELVCRQFAIGGYCFRGKACKFRHVHECPDFQLTHECPRGKNCRLTHSKRDNLDAKIQFSTLDAKWLQLPNLTQLEDIHEDPRIQQNEIMENIVEFNYDTTDDEREDGDDDEADDHTEDLQQDDHTSLEIDADFIQF